MERRDRAESSAGIEKVSSELAHSGALATLDRELDAVCGRPVTSWREKKKFKDMLPHFEKQDGIDFEAFAEQWNSTVDKERHNNCEVHPKTPKNLKDHFVLEQTRARQNATISQRGQEVSAASRSLNPLHRAQTAQQKDAAAAQVEDPYSFQRVDYHEPALQRFFENRSSPVRVAEPAAQQQGAQHERASVYNGGQDERHQAVTSLIEDEALDPAAGERKQQKDASSNQGKQEKKPKVCNNCHHLFQSSVWAPWHRHHTNQPPTPNARSIDVENYQAETVTWRGGRICICSKCLVVLGRQWPSIEAELLSNEFINQSSPNRKRRAEKTSFDTQEPQEKK